jgi:D-alanyl-D-alanine carboxypeptidase/D-alanyl-D-alanine-endopeptidase (penicillin-binding protein 4)
MKKILVSILFILTYSFAVGQSAVDAFVNAPNMRRANISFLVKDIETGEVVMQHRADKVTVPASTTKLVTTATALEILGPNYIFPTKLQYDGTLEEGVLNGNIYILGGGDPTLGSKFLGDSLFLERWVAAVKQLGIHKINGAVIGDASIFNTEGIAPKWSWEDMGNYYAAGAYGISIYDNTFKLYLKSGAVGSTPEIIRTEPSMPDLKIKLYLTAAADEEDNAYFYGAPYSNDRSIYGTIPAKKEAFVIKGDIPDPALYAAQIFAKKLQENEVEITKAPSTEIPESSTRRVFFTQFSPPLKDIIANINFKSNNHYAEHILRAISLKSSKQGDFNNSIKVIKSFWKARNLDVSGLVMFDGCGLASSNAISATFFVDLLIYEKTKGLYPAEFLASLPVAGQSGTIRSLLKDTRLEGKVQAKSGSIFSVQCFAGYITTNNKEYAFAILVDNYSGIRKNVVEQIEKLLLNVGK